MKLINYLAAIALATLAPMTTATAAPLSWPELAAMPLPPGAQKIPYGTLPPQFVELRLPQGKAPGPGWPVAVLLHGGCWQNAYDYVYFTRLAEALAAQGIASITVEYRRIGDDGGGWPGTFQDVASATDMLRSIASTKPLNLRKIIAAGHSAGGHLALWLAARGKLPGDSPLHVLKPLKLRGVVGIAPITDLVGYRLGGGSCNASVDALLGGDPTAVPDRYAQTSPWALLPLGVPQWLVQGAEDGIVPLGPVREYAAAAQGKGDAVTLIEIADAGHFDAVAPSTGAGGATVNAILAALGR